MVAAVALFAWPAMQSGVEPGTLLTKHSQDGTLLRVFYESSPFIPPPVKRNTWTNTDGSIGSVVPASGPRETNLFYVLNEHNGHVQTNGTIFRPQGPYRRDVFYVVAEAGGQARTNRALQWSEVRPVSQPQVRILDVLYEPPVAVYLYERYLPAVVSSQPSLALTIMSSSPTNTPLPSSGRVIWTPSNGVFSKITAKRMTGSYSAGTLAVEVTSIRGSYVKTQTNSLIGGKWVVSESEPVLLESESERVSPGKQ
jgi:hypothetical protein